MTSESIDLFSCFSPRSKNRPTMINPFSSHQGHLSSPFNLNLVAKYYETEHAFIFLIQRCKSLTKNMCHEKKIVLKIETALDAQTALRKAWVISTHANTITGFKKEEGDKKYAWPGGFEDKKSNWESSRARTGESGCCGSFLAGIFLPLEF